MNLYQLFKKKGEYRVIFYFPGTKLNGVYPKFMMSYMLKPSGLQAAGDLIIKAFELINDKLTGGLAINGSLSVNDQQIEFKPIFYASLMSDGFKQVTIPLADVIAIRIEQFLIVQRIIIVTTINGEFKLQVLGDFNLDFFSKTTDEIFSQINSHLTPKNELE